MRLNRYLAACGYGSRRACEELISGGEVTVNGEVCTTLATTITDSDQVLVGKVGAHLPDPVYYALHKPKGYITTAADTHLRKTIFDLLPPELQHLHYVGRLDQDSEGLLLLTNDGELSHRLAHPSRGVEKEYEVTLEQAWDPKSAKRLLNGMLIEEKSAKFERLRQVGPNTLRIVLHQGLKRQIRVMLLYVGYKVTSLVRLRIGELTLEKLPRGSHRKLRPQEVKALKIQAGMIAGPPVKVRPAAAEKPKVIPPFAEKTVTVKYEDDRPARGPRRSSAPAGRSPGPRAAAGSRSSGPRAAASARPTGPRAGAGARASGPRAGATAGGRSAGPRAAAGARSSAPRREERASYDETSTPRRDDRAPSSARPSSRRLNEHGVPIPNPSGPSGIDRKPEGSRPGRTRPGEGRPSLDRPKGPGRQSPMSKNGPRKSGGSRPPEGGRRNARVAKSGGTGGRGKSR